ncbi:MAG: hypothetical protein NVSMB32_07760 [Actinomycetota bacterium]
MENLVGYAKRDLMIPEGLTAEDLPGANTKAKLWCAEVNTVLHSEIAAIPAERVVAERELFGPLPSLRIRIGRTTMRKVDRLACIRIGSARYSVPMALADHALVAPGEASVLDAHYGGERPPPGERYGQRPLQRKPSAPSGRWRRPSSGEPLQRGSPSWEESWRSWPACRRRTAPTP